MISWLRVCACVSTETCIFPVFTAMAALRFWTVPSDSC